MLLGWNKIICSLWNGWHKFYKRIQGNPSSNPFKILQICGFDGKEWKLHEFAINLIIKVKKQENVIIFIKQIENKIRYFMEWVIGVLFWQTDLKIEKSSDGNRRWKIRNNWCWFFVKRSKGKNTTWLLVCGWNCISDDKFFMN